jgi:outer membrane protein assembly factor BamB
VAVEPVATGRVHKGVTRRRWAVAVIVVLAVAGASGIVLAASREGPPRACGLVGEAGPDLAAGAPRDTAVDGRYTAMVPAPAAVSAEPAPRWSVSLSSLGLTGADLVTGGPVLLAVTDREVVALTADDGAERWRVHCDDSPAPSVRAATLGTTVVVDTLGPDDNVVCGLDAGTGRRRWCRAGSFLEDSWDGTTVAVVHADGDDVEVSAIDVNNGAVGWRQRRPAARSKHPPNWFSSIDGVMASILSTGRRAR